MKHKTSDIIRALDDKIIEASKAIPSMFNTSKGGWIITIDRNLYNGFVSFTKDCEYKPWSMPWEAHIFTDVSLAEKTAKAFREQFPKSEFDVRNVANGYLEAMTGYHKLLLSFKQNKEINKWD